jgi:hypothetical protein
MCNYFIKSLHLFLNKPLSYKSPQSHIQHYTSQVISLIQNLIHSIKRDDSVNRQPQGQQFLLQGF